MILIETTVQHFRCFCQSCDPRYIFRTGTKILLLSASEYNGLDLDLVSHI